MDHHFIYRIRPTRAAMLAEGPTEREAAVIAAHFEYLQEKARSGVLFMAGRTLVVGDEGFGLVVFAADSLESARRFLGDDPAVRQGVMSGDVFPFRVALWAGQPVRESGA